MILGALPRTGSGASNKGLTCTKGLCAETPDAVQPVLHRRRKTPDASLRAPELIGDTAGGGLNSPDPGLALPGGSSTPADPDASRPASWGRLATAIPLQRLTFLKGKQTNKSRPIVKCLKCNTAD